MRNRWQRVRIMFDAVLALSEDKRRAYLLQLGKEDPQMRSDLEAMLSERYESSLRRAVGDSRSFDL